MLNRKRKKIQTEAKTAGAARFGLQTTVLIKVQWSELTFAIN